MTNISAAAAAAREHAREPNGQFGAQAHSAPADDLTDFLFVGGDRRAIHSHTDANITDQGGDHTVTCTLADGAAFTAVLDTIGTVTEPPVVDECADGTVTVRWVCLDEDDQTSDPFLEDGDTREYPVEPRDPDDLSNLIHGFRTTGYMDEQIVFLANTGHSYRVCGNGTIPPMEIANTLDTVRGDVTIVTVGGANEARDNPDWDVTAYVAAEIRTRNAWMRGDVWTINRQSFARDGSPCGAADRVHGVIGSEHANHELAANDW